MSAPTTQQWYDTLRTAHKEARRNGRGYALAIYSPPNSNFPEGVYQVTTRKPMLRDHDWTVIECRADGSEVLA